MEVPPLLIILGPTASGKTKLAVNLAVQLNAEIISADSRQVFKGMDIGTGKDLNEYERNGVQVPYHLIDIKRAGEQYNVNEFKEDFYRAFLSITDRGKLPILCGGTGMYIHSILQNQEYTAIPVNERIRDGLAGKDVEELRSVLDGYPVAFTIHADRSSRKRMVRAIEIADYLSHNDVPVVPKPEFKPLIFGLDPGRTLRRTNVTERLVMRLEDGLIEEVQQLLRNGVSDAMLTFYGLEYKFVASYLRNEIDYSALKELLTIAICQFAKRQMTFFRKMEKDGVQIHWLDTNEGLNKLTNSVLERLNGGF